MTTNHNWDFNGTTTLRSRSTFSESNHGTLQTQQRLERQDPLSQNSWTETFVPVQSHTGGITQWITHSKPAADNTITIPGQGTHTTVAPGGEYHAGTSTQATYLTVQQQLAEFVGSFTTKTGFVSLSAAEASAASGEHPSQTDGGSAGNNQNASNPSVTWDDEWMLPDDANGRPDSGLLRLSPDAAFTMMVRDPTFRAMLEQFLRNRDTWPNPDVMSDKSIWDTCMQLYWRVKFHQTLSAAEKAKFESSLNGATEDDRARLCDHWVFWYAPESVWLFVLAPEAAAEIAQQRLARANAVEKLASADSKMHYSELTDTYRSGKYTTEMLNSATGVYGEHFLAVLGVPLKGTQLAKEAIENAGGLVTGIGMVDDASRGIGAVDNLSTSRLGTYADEVRSVVSSQAGGLGRRFRRGGGNIAVSELQIGHDIVRIPAFSGTDDLAGFAPYVRNSDRVLGAGGAGRGAGNFLRDVDAEAKILERMLSLTTAETRGTLRLYSELPFCDSCQAVIANFHKYRPSLSLELVWKDGSRLIGPRLP